MEITTALGHVVNCPLDLYIYSEFADVVLLALDLFLLWFLD